MAALRFSSIGGGTYAAQRNGHNYEIRGSSTSWAVFYSSPTDPIDAAVERVGGTHRSLTAAQAWAEADVLERLASG